MPTQAQIIAAAAVLGLLLSGIGGAVWWHFADREQYADQQVDAAGDAASVTAFEERDTFKHELKSLTDAIREESEARSAQNAEFAAAFERLLKEDWDADLQKSGDFVDRANRATQRVWDHRGQRLQEIFAGGIGLPSTARALPEAVQADAVP